MQIRSTTEDVKLPALANAHDLTFLLMYITTYLTNSKIFALNRRENLFFLRTETILLRCCDNILIRFVLVSNVYCDKYTYIVNKITSLNCIRLSDVRQIVVSMLNQQAPNRIYSSVIYIPTRKYLPSKYYDGLSSSRKYTESRCLLFW